MDPIIQDILTYGSAFAGCAAGCTGGGLITATGLGAMLYVRRAKRDKLENFLDTKIGKNEERVAKIDIYGKIGPIRNKPSSNPNSEIVTFENIKNKIDQARKKGAKAYIFSIESPGGSAITSRMIHDYIKKIEVPKYAEVLSVAASGGYMAACACDEIFVDQDSIIGSIGAMMMHIEGSELLSKIGIKPTLIGSGANKGMGSPFIELRHDQEKLLRDHILKFHRKFVQMVADDRNMTYHEVQQYADGWIMDGKEAIKAGLVDRIGNSDDILELLKEEHNFKKPKIVPTRPKLKLPFPLSQMIGSLSSTIGKNLTRGIVEEIETQTKNVNLEDLL